jgi:hypothetical protein
MVFPEVRMVMSSEVNKVSVREMGAKILCKLLHDANVLDRGPFSNTGIPNLVPDCRILDTPRAIVG